jgi:hypothetical protein
MFIRPPMGMVRVGNPTLGLFLEYEEPKDCWNHCGSNFASVPARKASRTTTGHPLIMPDQWRGDALSILGCAGVTTPQLDQLAREGALFRRAYATVPSCIPARYGFLTGLSPQTSGVVGP